MFVLYIVEPLNRVNNAGNAGGKNWIAVIGKVHFVAYFVSADGDPESLFNNAGRGFEIDDEPVLITIGYGESLTLCPVDNFLLVFY